MSEAEIEAINGIKCASPEEAERVTKEFWDNAFITPGKENSMYLERFKKYYESFTNNLPNPFEKWKKMTENFRWFLDRNMLNPNFALFFVSLLVLYEPRRVTLNEFFNHYEIKGELIQIFVSLDPESGLNRG